MANAARPATTAKSWPPMVRRLAPLSNGAGAVVDAAVVVDVTGADPVAVADVVLLPTGKGGMTVADVVTGTGTTGAGVEKVSADEVEVVEGVDADDVVDVVDGVDVVDVVEVVDGVDATGVVEVVDGVDATEVELEEEVVEVGPVEPTAPLWAALPPSQG